MARQPKKTENTACRAKAGRGKKTGLEKEKETLNGRQIARRLRYMLK